MRRGGWRRALRWLVLGCLAGATGCAKPEGDVGGKVTYKGKNLEYGTVTFLSSDGGSYQADIQSDGSYSLKGVPAGPARVAVACIDPKGLEEHKKLVEDNRNKLKGNMKGTVTFNADKYAVIPKRYRDADESGLQLDVKGGQNVYNIDLK
jgi:hypothetical protein